MIVVRFQTTGPAPIAPDRDGQRLQTSSAEPSTDVCGNHKCQVGSIACKTLGVCRPISKFNEIYSIVLSDANHVKEMEMRYCTFAGPIGQD